MRKTALALILSVSCVICSGNILLVQAEEPGQVALEGLQGTGILTMKKNLWKTKLRVLRWRENCPARL